jgi:NADP-dependent 3-hydroxy acid dehydrogenase YdfG
VDSIVAACHACLEKQGLPDVVVANAGISVGVDTAARTDLDVMSRVFATNNIGMAATFHPFIEGMSDRGSGTLVGIGSVAGHPRIARTWRLLRQQGRGDRVLREPARRKCEARA